VKSLQPIALLDTTLRDGALTPGVRFTTAARIEIALALERAGIDVIEASFPARGDEDREGLAAVAAALQAATVCALCRAEPAEIDVAAALMARAHRSRLHVFAGGAPRQDRSTIDRASRVVAHARSAAHEVQFTPLDATRLETTFLLELVAAAIEAGASVINLSDTLGVALPGDIAALLATVRGALPADRNVTLSFHGHDDLGLATACALAAVAEGARQLEVCMNGLGPRAGNTPLEEVATVLTCHGERLGASTRVTASALRDLSALVASRSGVVVPPAKAVVGEHATTANLETLVGAS
jgi:2-isopropylmalate synthase